MTSVVPQLPLETRRALAPEELLFFMQPPLRTKPTIRSISRKLPFPEGRHENSPGSSAAQARESVAIKSAPRRVARNPASGGGSRGLQPPGPEAGERCRSTPSAVLFRNATPSVFHQRHIGRVLR